MEFSNNCISYLRDVICPGRFKVFKARLTPYADFHISKPWQCCGFGCSIEEEGTWRSAAAIWRFNQRLNSRLGDTEGKTGGAPCVDFSTFASRLCSWCWLVWQAYWMCPAAETTPWCRQTNWISATIAQRRRARIQHHQWIVPHFDVGSIVAPNVFQILSIYRQNWSQRIKMDFEFVGLDQKASALPTTVAPILI